MKFNLLFIALVSIIASGCCKDEDIPDVRAEIIINCVMKTVMQYVSIMIYY